jgi:hypothetical protein
VKRENFNARGSVAKILCKVARGGGENFPCFACQENGIETSFLSSSLNSFMRKKTIR